MIKNAFRVLRTSDTVLFIASARTRLKQERGVGRVSSGFIQNPMTRALALSLLLHAAIITPLVFSVDPKLRHEEIIRVSLVDELPSGAAMTGKAGRAEKVVAASEVPRKANRAPTEQKRNRLISSQSLPAPSPEPAPTMEAVSERPIAPQEPVSTVEATSLVSPLLNPHATGPGNANNMDDGATGGGVAGTTGRGAGQGAGRGGDGQAEGVGPGPGTGQAAAYMREHFVYIRDLIMRNLAYPLAARRLGWKGAVTVCFVVLENGAAQNIRVIKSSGHDILDQAVVKTIQQTQPFPKPPVRAELTIPIVFRLESGTG